MPPPPPPPLETTMPPRRTAVPCFVTRRLAKKNPVGSTNMTALVSEGPFTGPDASSFTIGAISRHLAAASSLLRCAWAAHRSMKVIRPLRTLSRCRCSHRAACSSPLRCARAAQRSRGVMCPVRAFSRCRSCHRAARSSLLRCTSAVHSSRKPNPPGPPHLSEHPPRRPSSTAESAERAKLLPQVIIPSNVAALDPKSWYPASLLAVAERPSREAENALSCRT